MPAYLNTKFDPGNKYSVPYAMSITMLGYNDEKMKELGITVDSWAVIFDPKILAKIKGKVTVLDSQSELMAAALQVSRLFRQRPRPQALAAGQGPHHQGQAVLGGVHGAGYIKELTTGNIWVSHGYSNDIFQAETGAQEARQKFHIRHALPKEGAVLALDAMVIAKDAPRPDLAHQFINFMLDGTQLRRAHQHHRLGQSEHRGDAAHQARDQVDQGGVSRRGVGQALEQLEDMNSKERRLLNRIWTEIKVK